MVEEAVRLVKAAAARGLVMRLLGGAAVRFHVGDAMPASLSRSIEDVDLAAAKGRSRQVSALLSDEGYAPSQAFNAVHGADRLLFMDEARRRHVDVFVGSFQMCHALPLTERLQLDPVTLPLAELLMTKLQIVKLNRKDMSDVYALLVAHEVGDHDAEVINAKAIGKLAGADWGLFHTFQLNLVRLGTELGQTGLSANEKATISTRLAELVGALNREPKSIKWRLRSRVGERIAWYEEPDEIERRAIPVS